MIYIIIPTIIAYLAAHLNKSNKVLHWSSTSIAILLHTIITGYLLISKAGWFFSVQNTLVLISLLVFLILVIFHIQMRFTHIITTTFSIIALLWVLLWPHQPDYTPINWATIVHVLFSLIAYSILSAASLLAIGLWLQTRQLRKIRFNTVPVSPNSLLINQNKLFRMTTIGWLFLTGSLLSGIIFVNNYIGQQIGHKVLFSIIAWILFGLLIIGRFIRGWPGKTIIRMHLAAMLLLAIGYLGSKVVLEYLINQYIVNHA